MILGYLSKLTEELDNLLTIQTPMIWIQTREEYLAEKAAVHLCAKKHIAKQFCYVSSAGGAPMDPITLRDANAAQMNDLEDMFETNQKSMLPEQISNVNMILGIIENTTSSIMLVLRDPEDVFQNRQTQRMLYDICARKKTHPDLYCPIVMISPVNTVPEMLKDVVSLVELPLMNETENFYAICQWLKTTGNRVSKSTALAAAKAATGLSSIQLHHVLDDSWNRTNTLDIKIINEARVETIRQSSILRYIEPQKTLDSIGGHQNLKRWIKEVKACNTAEAKSYGVHSAKGYLALGPAGTGKTAIAEAVANYFGVPLIIFDLSKIMGSLVGQSEQTARRAFEIIKSVGPSVVLLDEADKQLAATKAGGTVSDGGTILRVFDVVLQNLQQNTDQFYILTTNDIESLPAPLMRAGRLDKKWFFMFPNEEERKDIFRIYFARANKNVAENLLEYAAKSSDHYTGAEIETAVNNIIRLSFLQKKEIDDTIIWNGIHEVSSVYNTNRTEVDDLLDYARKNHIPFTSVQQDKQKRVITEKERERLDSLNTIFDEKL